MHRKLAKYDIIPYTEIKNNWMCIMIKNKVLKYIKENNMIQTGEHIIIGVSGGADSMCLLNVLMELKDELMIKLTVVHVHHGIRGREADEDMEYVEKFCGRNHIEFFGYRYDIPAIASEKGKSTEEAGREARYYTFNMVKDDVNADKIAVAHNAGDNIETIMLNICRGTGISGMAGIQPYRGNIIRPVMCLDREEIEAYLQEKNIKYRIDSTNLENDYTRNKIRNIVIPYLKENINDRADKHIEALGRLIRETDDYMEKQGELALSQVTVNYDRDKQEYSINVYRLKTYHVAVMRTVIRKAMENVSGKLKDITMKHVDMVMETAFSETGKKVNLPYNMEAVKYPEELIIRKCRIREKNSGKKVIINKIPGEYVIGNKKIIIDKDLRENVIFEEKTYTKWLGYDILKDNFEIRTRQEGDYIVINSQGGRKKLKDYFIDKKIPHDQRDDILLLAVGHHIAWVVGYRISEAFKVNESTNNIIKVQLKEI